MTEGGTPDLTCPACARLVSRNTPLCPACGANLSVTVATEPRTDTLVAEAPEPIRFRPGESFAGRYTIIEQVRSGGMGQVYKAIDTAVDSVVALKLILPSLAEIPAFRERFRREARVTRQITHPNICRVHDIGESNGVLYLSMEWIEGETLRQLLRQAGMLREARAVEIAQRIALALEAAHAAGVVHRDLKPANVMIDERGSVVVLDFGLALEQGSADLTAVGMLVGTPQYMAPEQRAGRAVDGRADQYALGMILFEMLTGRRLEDGGDASPAEVNPAIGPVLRRLLAANPGERYPTTPAARDALQRLGQDPAISTPPRPLPPPAPRWWQRPRLWLAAVSLAVVAVAVLAFVQPRPGLPAEARALYEEGLHKLRGEAESGRELRAVIHLFNRALDKAPDSPLIMATLGEAYWRLYNTEKTNTARDQAERYLDSALRRDPDLPELRNARAVGFLIDGKYEAAKAELEQAVRDSPSFAAAWINLGSAHRNLEQYVPGLDALRKAEQLEPESSLVQLSLGTFFNRFQRLEEAERSFRRATELKPDSIVAWNNLGALQLHGGRYPEAEQTFRKSIEIEEYGDSRSNLGTALYFQGRFEDAAREYRRAIALKPSDPNHLSNLGDALRELEREDEAGQAYARACVVAQEEAMRHPLVARSRADAALFCAQAGNAKAALEHARRAAELQPDNATHMLMTAAMCAKLGRLDEAHEWLERAVRFGVSRVQIELRPELVALKKEERFAKLLDLAQ